jgi:hypothetical protein
MRLFDKLFKNDDKVEQLFKNFITYDSPDKPLVNRLRDILSLDPVEKSKATPTVSTENIKNPEDMELYFTGMGLQVVFKKSCPFCGVKTFVKQRPDCTCDTCGTIGRVIPVNVNEIA